MSTWWVEPLRVDLAEIMDDLDPGWASWREVTEPVLGELD